MTMTSSPDVTPRWLWRVVRVALLAVMAVGVAGVIVLGAGAADPSRAGPLLYEDATPHTLTTSPNSNPVIDPDFFAFPKGAFTLEVSARFSVESDPTTAWGIVLGPPQTSNSSTPFYSARLNGFRQFAVWPTQPDFTPFIHIRANGQTNKLTLDVRSDGSATLRINDEVAWTGRLPVAGTAMIELFGGQDSAAALTVERIAVYGFKDSATQKD